LDVGMIKGLKANLGRYTDGSWAGRQDILTF